MNAHTPLVAYEIREEHCPECGGSGARMGCTREIECFDCSGQGSWEATCADCSEVKPLNIDGVCESCAAEDAILDLTVTQLTGGRWGVAA